LREKLSTICNNNQNQKSQKTKTKQEQKTKTKPKIKIKKPPKQTPPKNLKNLKKNPNHSLYTVLTHNGDATP